MNSASTLYTSGWVVTCDHAGTEHESGWLLVENGVIAAVGSGDEPEADQRVDLAGAVVTPGLVNTHHHLYQTLTRARAQEADLFGWLRALYPVWSRLDAEAEYAAARTGLAELARRLDLGLDEAAPPAREDVVVVEDGRAAGERELREPCAGCGVLRLGVDP